MLLLDVVLADERLVLDDIDEPSDIVDFGLCTSVEVSLDDRTKLSRLWAITKKKWNFRSIEKLLNHTFVQKRLTTYKCRQKFHRQNVPEEIDLFKSSCMKIL